MASTTGIELASDSCLLVGVRPGRGGAGEVLAVQAIAGAEWPAYDAARVEVLSSVRRGKRLPRRAVVVAWGLPDDGLDDESTRAAVQPIETAGFRIQSVLTPPQALARVAGLPAAPELIRRGRVACPQHARRCDRDRPHERVALRADLPLEVQPGPDRDEGAAAAALFAHRPSGAGSPPWHRGRPCFARGVGRRRGDLRRSPRAAVAHDAPHRGARSRSRNAGFHRRVACRRENEARSPDGGSSRDSSGVRRGPHAG